MIPIWEKLEAPIDNYQMLEGSANWKDMEGIANGRYWETAGIFW